MNLDDLPDDICPWCGAGFTARMITQKFCSVACQKESRNAFLRQVTRAEREALRCQWCGGPMNAKKSDAKFCSPVCFRKAAWERKHGRLADIRCVDCGGPILDALTRKAQRCAVCVRAWERQLDRKARERRRAAARE